MERVGLHKVFGIVDRNGESYSLFNEASGVYKNYIALGNQLNLKNVQISYDFKISIEDLDRTGIISEDVPDNLYNFALENTLYYSHWLKVDWTFRPKWHLVFTGFIDYAKWRGDQDPIKDTDDWRTAYSFIPTIEYHPWDDLNLKFFFGYVGRYFEYSDYAESRVGLEDFNTGRIMLGVISPLKIL